MDQVAKMTASDRAIHDLKVVIDDVGTCREISSHVIKTMEDRQGSPEEIESLGIALRQHVAAFLARIDADRAGLHWERDGMLKFDSIGLEFLSKIGPAGIAAADAIRPNARACWAGYIRSPISDEKKLWWWWSADGGEAPGFVLELAAVLWRDHARNDAADVGPSQSAETKHGLDATIAPKAPLVSAKVLRLIVGAFFSKHTRLVPIGSETRLVNSRGEFLAVVSADVAGDHQMVNKFVESTRTLLAQRLLRFLVQAGVQSHFVSKHHDRGLLEIPGGLSGLAKTLGVAGSKGTQLGPILDAFQHLHLRLPHGKTESLVQWTLDPESSGQRALLRIVLHDALLPNFVVGLDKHTAAQREARRLVPIPSVLPPLVGHVHSFFSQALLHLFLLDEMSAQAEEFYENQWVRIPWERWETLAREAGLRPGQLQGVFIAWTQGEGAFLKRQGNSDLFTLADAYAIELNSIIVGGKKSARGRARQAKSAKRKA